jgi:hypothetical protein
MREAGRCEPGRLEAVREALKAFPEDWILALEVEELCAGAAAPKAQEPGMERP